MKNALPVLFLFIIGFSQSGYYIFSLGHQYLHKKQVEKEILNNTENKNLVCISYTDHKGEIFWEEKNKEFFFVDKMYDIIRTDTVSGKILLYCADDVVEKKIVSQTVETAKNNHIPDKKIGITKTELPVLFFSDRESFSPHLVQRSMVAIHYTALLHKGNKETTSPPPKACFS